MARIGLSNGFTLIPKGSHVFKIVDVEYKEDFGKMNVTMQTAKGLKHIERFTLVTSNGAPNEGGLNAFSFFAKTALNDYTLTEIDHTDLIGHYIRCEVDHEKVESNKNAGKFVTFIRLTDKEPADGFDEPETAQETASGEITPVSTTPSQKSAQNVSEGTKKGFDLSSLLG